MNSLRIKALVFGLIGIAIGFLGANRHQTFINSIFPSWVITTPDASKVRVVLPSVKTNLECKQLLHVMTASLQTTCSNCKVVKEDCDQKISTANLDLASGMPMPHPVAHIQAGIAVFEGENTAQQLASCQKTVAATGEPNSRCYPAGEKRPSRSLETTEAVASTAPLFFICLSALCLIYSISLWIRSTPALLEQLLLWPRAKKQGLMLVTDLLIIEASIWAAFALRFETLDPSIEDTEPLLAIAPLIAIPVFVRLGLYRSVVRYVGLQAMVAVLKAVGIYTALLALAIFLLPISGIPRSTLILQGLVSCLLIGLSRAIARHIFQGAFLTGNPNKSAAPRKKVAIYGAGSAGMQLANALSISREYEPVIFLDDSTDLHNKTIGNWKVFPPNQFSPLINRFGIEEVLLAIPSASRNRRNQIIDELEPLPVHVKTLPGLTQFTDGKVSANDLQEVDIEDLLGRDPVPPETSLLSANIHDKVVMVTGAGGSIGSELCRQILDQRPTHLLLFEISEFGLYTIEQELIQRAKANGYITKLVPLLGSVCNQERLERIIERFKVQTIYHAAAYKHVPLVEYNPCEGAFNNVLGTYRCALAALRCGAETFVLVSTDKAVRPTNTMGTTKRLAELTLQALAEAYPDKTRFTMVRFGNVLGSSGSVVPLFRKQISCGGPVTVTDPRIIRYFMTIPEAAQLVIQAGAMGSDGDVFVLDMGEPVKITDLAERMIHLSGLSVKNELNPDGDIEIVFSGLRPGEKLYEELLIGDNVSKTAHSRIMRANEKQLPLASIEELVERLTQTCLTGDSDTTREILQTAVEEFAPQCSNEDLLKH